MPYTTYMMHACSCTSSAATAGSSFSPSAVYKSLSDPLLLYYNATLSIHSSYSSRSPLTPNSTNSNAYSPISSPPSQQSVRPTASYSILGFPGTIYHPIRDDKLQSTHKHHPQLSSIQCQAGINQHMYHSAYIAAQQWAVPA